MRTALIIGSGATVREEFAAVEIPLAERVIIGVNWGGLVAEPSILFGNHAQMLVEKIAPDVERQWGRRHFELHTTPLRAEINYARGQGLTMWRAAYRKCVGSGICAALAARLMGFDRAVLIGCPHHGPYEPGRRNSRAPKNDNPDWGSGFGEAGREKMDAGLRAVVPELLGFATSTSGMTADLLGTPEWMHRQT